MKYLFILSFMLLTLVSCEKDNPVTPTVPVSPEKPVVPTNPSNPTNPSSPSDPTNPDNQSGSTEPVAPVVYSFSIDKTIINATSNGKEETISVSTNGDWKASCSEAWVTVAPFSGTKDDTSAKITIAENISTEPRFCDLVFASVPLDSRVIVKIKQEAKIYHLTLDKKDINTNSEVFTDQIALTTNDEWTATVNTEWVKISAAKGQGDASIDISIEENTSTEKRSALIVIIGKNSAISESINIEQSGARPLIGMENDHEYVDLGLPSGTLWATCNIGASKPEEYGNYFKWADHTPMADECSWDTYLYCKNGSYRHLTKYNYNMAYGVVDNITKVLPDDDAAHGNWGGRWRMPTDAEFQELIDECTYKEVNENGRKGFKFISKTNGQSIYLPLAGNWSNGDNGYDNYMGFYWSSSLNLERPDNANVLKFLHSPYINFTSRYMALPVRAVFIYSE